jgi:hypothetical protein
MTKKDKRQRERQMKNCSQLSVKVKFLVSFETVKVRIEKDL